MIKTIPYDVVEQLRTTEEMTAYLGAWLDDAPDDTSGIARARSEIERAKAIVQAKKGIGK